MNQRTLTETCVFRNNDQILEDNLLTSVSTQGGGGFVETELWAEKKKKGLRERLGGSTLAKYEANPRNTRNKSKDYFRYCWDDRWALKQLFKPSNRSRVQPPLHGV